MKKLLILFLMILGLNSNAQELNGCMGIQFGESKASVKQKMTEKSGFELYNSKEETVSYINGTFAGRKAVGAVFKFYNDELHTVIILLDIESEPMAMNEYQKVLNDLNDKYGVKFEKIHNFKKPYYEGDGYEHNAIRLGYADIFAFYEFSNKCAMSVEITKEMSIKLTYQDSKRAEVAIDKNKQNNSKDY